MRCAKLLNFPFIFWIYWNQKCSGYAGEGAFYPLVFAAAAKLPGGLVQAWGWAAGFRHGFQRQTFLPP